ncbi:MAG: hypothetical protein H7Y18_07775 [Clostridiaceae bacterium]|nr:hypothetical protein [Clostridiaceae bacterium]
MKYLSKELNDWAIDKIKKEYPKDICLLIGHEHWKIAPDGEDIAFNFFIPATDRGYQLSQTFIIDGIGYDLFPMSWERVEGIANLNESLATCLGDGVILYARKEEDKEHFLKLQKQLKNNLNNSELTYRKGLEKINMAMELLQNMLYEKSLSGIRKASGYIVAYLAEAVATVNGTYFQSGPENQITVLSKMTDLPDGFISMYQNIVMAKGIEETKELCYKMVGTTREFFNQRKVEKETKIREYNYEELAGWYQEGSYWFRRIYYYCDQKDSVNCFAWGCSMQREVDWAREEFGLETVNLMDVFDPADLRIFHKRAEELENYIVSEIEKNGVKIRKFQNLDEFLKQNS